ncbi:MAG: hypothetical protein MUE50_26735 [Pirellulaceae bacterium]|nr:hypothetical protein [Pirellulaceae bacterium]
MRIYRLSLDKRWLWRAMPIAALTACVLAASAGRAVAAQEEEGAGPPAVHDNRGPGDVDVPPGGTGTDRHRVRKPDLPDRRHGDLRDLPSTSGAGRTIAWAHRREHRDATWLSRADRGAHKTSRCLPGRLAGRKPGRIGMARRRVRMPDRKVRLQVVLKDAASIAGADRKIAKAHRREHRDAN